MSETRLNTLLRVIRGGRDSLTAEVMSEFETLGEACVPALVDVASSEALLTTRENEGWAPIHAVRILGHLGRLEAVPALLHILDGAEDDDLVSAEVGCALERIGTGVVPDVADFIEQTENPHGRGIALEVVANLAVQYRGANALANARRSIERLLVASEDSTTRSMLVRYLGDLGDVGSVTVLLRLLYEHASDISQLEYEAIRDVLERLGSACPDYYFDSAGRGYPLNEEKHPLCPACRAPMNILEPGDLQHPGNACALSPAAPGGAPASP